VKLLFGALRSRRREANLARIRDLQARVRTVPLTQATIERYADVRAALTSSGIAKSDFDLLIACTALEHGAVLITADRALLDGRISGLQAENWLSD
jgi:predicted nucleic acid-binding protein